MEREIIYLQIDFLRLFRLVRRLKYINRNRIMPSKYDNVNDAVNCCKRLMKSVLLKIFPRDIANIKTYGSEFKIFFNKKYTNLFDFFIDYKWVENEEEIKKKFYLLCRDRSSLRIYLRSINNYNIIISTKMFVNSYIIGRTAHRFYNVFLEILEYKKLWDSIIPELFLIMNRELGNDQKVLETSTKKVLKTPTQEAFDIALTKYLRRKNT